MGYIFSHSDASLYEEQLKRPENQKAAGLEHRLMLRMLKPLRGKLLLDIGCGTGASLVPFFDAGLNVTGLDPSRYMLDIALKTLGHHAELYPGVAEDLPFEDNSFHYACLIKTLEFVENPRKAIEEACRVARDKVFIGFINRHSLKASGMRIKRLFTKTLYTEANLFSVWELKTLIHSVAGNMPVSWRTICQMPPPFGAYGGIVITLAPQFRTTPIEIPYEANCAKEPVAGLAKIKRRPAKNGSVSV
jgi:SAM-dependent methyltransferase